MQTLMQVAEHHDVGGTANPWLSTKIFPLGRTVQEERDLVRFMTQELTGVLPSVEVPGLP
ncbi:MAG: hypothetical protein V3T22_06730 [Planctomycetota bacterium]